MRVVGSEIAGIGGTLAQPLANARGAWRERRGWLLGLHDDAGCTGQGEASPLPGYSPDTLYDVRAALADVAEGLTIDLAAEIPPQIGSALDRVPFAVPSARFALETALFDLVGQRLARPLRVLLGGPLAARAVALSALIDGETTEALIASATAAIARGIETLKVKIGRDFLERRRIDALALVRRAIGDRAMLRLDANGAFAEQVARAMLVEVRGLDVQFVEEPVERGGMVALLDSPVPLAADESLQRTGALERLGPLLASRVCTALVLKPMALGGMLRCLELARRGAALGARPVITHLYDGPVALAAASALALAVSHPLACGLDRHPALAAFARVELPFLDDALILPSDAPGLGLPRLEAP